MSKKSFDELLNGYENNQLTEEELAHFLHLVQQETYAQKFNEAIEKSFENDSISGMAPQNRAEAIFQKIREAARKKEDKETGTVVPFKQGFRRFNFLRIAVAASILGLLLLGASLWFNGTEKNETAKSEKTNKRFKNDVLPGGNKAVLTLADGSTIVLDDAQNGALAQQGNTRIIKLGGKLAYNPAHAGAREVLYNTIATPRGGQYQIELPDGSQVWLNAASSLRFPTAFVGKERSVEITGEAYFEVAKNKAMPFIVHVNGAEIKVLGTHFNVMAYGNEAAVKTTLLEGSVTFVSGNNDVLLRPGQQSQLTNEGKIKVVSDVDIDNVIAWKNGLFYFDNADLEAIMRQLARWYDVDVDFKGRQTDNRFFAKIPISSKLSDVLKVLELAGNIKFEIEGKKITVLQ